MEVVDLSLTSNIISRACREGRKALLETEAKVICVEYKIPVTISKMAKNLEEAVDYAEQIGYPIVLKIVSPKIIHKSDVGGVILNLNTPTEVRNAYERILENVNKYNPEAKIAGVLVQEMAPKSTEVIVGAVNDPQFGQTLMFGLGGIFVELLKDVTFWIAPLTREDAGEMVTKVKAYPILEGYRNTPPADVEAIINTLLNTSKLVMDYPEIKEVDLNPIMVYQKGAKTVDTRIILK